jgi:hypothetical protein
LVIREVRVSTTLRSGIRDIEIIGLPGAGKSTLKRVLVPQLKRAYGMFWAPSDRTATPETLVNLPKYVQARPKRVLIWHFLEFNRTNPQLARIIQDRLAWGEEISQYMYFSMNIATYHAHGLRHKPELMLVLDEGFGHRGIEMFLDLPDDAPEIEQYFSLVPVPELTIHLKVSPETAFERRVGVLEGHDRERKIRKLGSFETFVRRDALIKRHLAAVSARGGEVLTLDGETLDDGGRLAATEEIVARFR